MMLTHSTRACSSASSARPGSSSSSSSSRARLSRPALRVVASSNGSSSIAEGATVKVVKSVKVFHVPKCSEGMDLEGWEGTVAKDVTEYKGKKLSANLQYKVEFKKETDGKPTKFFAHLEAEELQQV